MTTSEPTGSSSLANMKVQIILAVVAVVVLVIVLINMSSEPKQQVSPPQAVATPAAEPIVETPSESDIIKEEIEEVIPEAQPEYTATPEPEPIPEPEPLDISDAAVKTAILALSEYPTLAEVVVNDDLLRRFVVFTNNLAEETLTENHQFLNVPQGQFRIYRQAGKEWIDAASYKRYSAYADALDAIETEQLVALYNTYKPAIDEIFQEIGNPSDSMDERFLLAIEHLLDTPEIPVPVEVYSDSVMYKYRNERIENLSAPQKQLLRTGPENMRQIKAKLREIKEVLER